MNQQNRNQVLKLVDAAHASVETFYPETPVYKDTPEWTEKRRLLLADLALHLAQDAMRGETIKPDSLRNHLFAILKVSGEFFPNENYTEAAALIDKPIAIV